jgi:starch synthase (maltosyl-transferring)
VSNFSFPASGTLIATLEDRGLNVTDLIHIDGRRRVVIEGIHPEIDAGRFAIKRAAGESVTVEADVFADGHDSISCQVLYKRAGESAWRKVPMSALGNDRWRANFRVGEMGEYLYTIEGWVDRFKTWRGDLAKRIKGGQDIDVDLLIGAELLESAARRATLEADRAILQDAVSVIRDPGRGAARSDLALSDDLLETVQRWPDLSFATRYERELRVVVDRIRARFSTWYELFPRSCSPDPDRHGTFTDCIGWLPHVAAAGFDVVYLPPIHPIGHSFRKGRNNAPTAAEGDVGSPWAIGSEEGGHLAIHPQLGTLADFEKLLAATHEKGMEVALDIAFQCTPDHPWVKEHPEWFRKRPDGSIQYAENPPKKYQDIYPIDFETEDWRALWEALKNVFTYWAGRKVRIFRVDNPHTKAFPFWEWAIAEVKRSYPDALFLAEAFTRPRVMYRLAKLGFSQSYTYFTWRNTKQEIRTYFEELTRSEVREYFRPNLWPNTPDILPETLQIGGRPAFMMRLILAATLGANYGIYGPAFELMEHTPREPGGEEYLNSEKYELKSWNVDSPDSLKSFIARVNRIRLENEALQQDRTLRFHETDNPALICYSKMSDDGSNIIVTVVNLDWAHTQAGWITIEAEALGLDPTRSFEAHDLLGGGRYLWQGPKNYVELQPGSLPAHIMRVRRWMRTERDFDYYL